MLFVALFGCLGGVGSHFIVGRYLIWTITITSSPRRVEYGALGIFVVDVVAAVTVASFASSSTSRSSSIHGNNALSYS